MKTNKFLTILIVLALALSMTGIAFAEDGPPPEETPSIEELGTEEPPAEEPTAEEPTAEPTEESTPEPTQEATIEPTQEPTAESTPDPVIEPAPVAPTFILSDKDDYYMGETVTLTGGNWQPSESIRLHVNDDQWQSWYLLVDIQADENGAFTYQFQLPEWFVAVYRVTATGEFSGTVVMTFTDAPKVGGVSVGPQTPNPVAAGNSATYQVAVYRGGGGGSSGSFTASLSIISSLPPGVSASFSPNPVSFTPSDGVKFATLTVSTTASTPPGPWSFTVRAATSIADYAYGGNSLIVFSACTPPSIIVQPTSASITVGSPVSFFVGANGTPPLNYQWRKNTVSIVGANGSGYAIGSTLVSDSGSYDVVVSNSCGSTLSFPANLTVNKATPSISWANPADINYGTSLSETQLNATASIPGLFVYTPATGVVLGFGSHTLHVDFTPTDTTNYNNASKEVTINVLQASSSVTVTCPAVVQPYTGLAQTPCAASYSTSDGLSGPLTPTYADNMIVGTATASATYAGDANHEGGSNSSTFEIGKASSTVIVSCPTSVSYDGSAQEPCTANVTGIDGLNETLPVNYTDNTNAGTASASANYAGDANHNPGNDATTFIINKADAVVSLSCPVSVVYNGAAQEPCTADVTGAGGLSETLTVHYSNNLNAGTADANTSYAGDANHNPGRTATTFTIDKADVQCTVSGYTGMYDGNPHGATGTCTGIEGEDLSGNLALGDSFTNVPGGTANWTYSDSTGNYKDQNDSVAIILSKANPICTVTGYDVTYDAASHTATGSCIGVKSETLSEPDLSGTTHINAGDYTDSWAFTDTTGNYSNDTGTVNNNIDRANAVCTVTGYDVTYDAISHTADGFCLGVEDEVLAGLDLSSTTHTHADAYTDSWTFTDVTGNYNNNTGNVNDNIDKADADCAIASYDLTYDGDSHTATGECKGVEGETLAGLDLSGTTHTNASLYKDDPWVFTDVTGNYNNNSGKVDNNIDKADPVCTITPYDTTYDGNAHTATGECKGVKNETLAGLDLTSTTHTNAGAYTDGWTFTDVTGNYNNDAGNTSDNIEKANAICTVAGYSGLYDTLAHGASGSCVGVINENLSNDLDLGAFFTIVPGGTANWTFTDSTGNYNNQGGSVVIVINKADATCTISGYTGVYDTLTHGATGSCIGIGSENAGTLDLGDSFTNVPGGTAYWVFTGNGNYEDESGDVNIVITKADATCIVTGYMGLYDAATHSATGSCTGIGGEDAGTLDLGDSFTNVPGGTAHWVFTGNGNYEDESSDVEIILIKADALCAITGYSVTYDGNSHTATGECKGVEDEILTGLDLNGTTHTNASLYKDDPWTFIDVTGNYNNTSGKVDDNINKADVVCTLTPYDVTYNGISHTATGQCKGVKNEILAGLDLTGTTHTNAGDYPIDAWMFTDVTGNYNDKNGILHDVIKKALLTITPDNQTRQYSDPNPSVFTFNYSGFIIGENKAVLTTEPACTTTRTVESAPGAYDITCAGGVDENYNFDYKLGAFTVTQEDARAYYTGNTLFWGATSTATSASVTLSATIKDITAETGDPTTDPDAGDIRYATVTFLSNGNPISGCTNLSVSLVDAGELKVGTVTCKTTLSIGSSGASTYIIGIHVDGYYTYSGGNEIITVAQPLTTNFITGGGYLVLSNSAGKYAGGAGTKVNYGFNIKYNKNRTNLQGNVNIIFRANGKVYQIKSNSLQSLGVSCTAGSSGTPTKPCKANFISKANLTDITNPTVPIALGGNLTLQMQMTDFGEPGSSDSIAFALYDGSKLLFSSNWNGTKTVEQIVGGGNLVVH